MSNAQAGEQVMPERPIGAPAQSNPRRPKRGSYTPQAETLSLLKVSGNSINGLGDGSVLKTPCRMVNNLLKDTA